MKKILIIEDAGPDRRRFRILLDEALRTLRTNATEESEKEEPVKYSFAWNAQEKRVLWQNLETNKAEITSYIEDYEQMFLDLAWTKYEEDVMNKAKRQSKSWLMENADQWTEQAKLEISPIQLRGNGLVSNISGFALLDLLKEGGTPKTKVTVTTGFFSEAVVEFCADRWGATALKKWEDENKIEAFIRQAIR